MIVPDVNLLLYANVAAFEQHARAKTWWEQALSGEEEVGLVAPALYGFIRIGTNPRVFKKPMSVDDALARIDGWLERTSVRFLLPGPRHLETAFLLLRKLGTAGNLTTNVQIAAFALEYQAELHSNDTDFARFPGLRWMNPLATRIETGRGQARRRRSRSTRPAQRNATRAMPARAPAK